MNRLSFKAAAVAAAVAVAGLAALPAVAQDSKSSRGSEVSGTAPAKASMKEAVHAILAEAGVTSGQMKGDREDRTVKGLIKLVEAGIIDEAKVGEVNQLAKTGELGSVMSERAKATSADRKAAAEERKQAAKTSVEERKEAKAGAARGGAGERPSQAGGPDDDSERGKSGANGERGRSQSGEE